MQCYCVYRNKRKEGTQLEDFGEKMTGMESMEGDDTYDGFKTEDVGHDMTQFTMESPSDTEGSSDPGRL